MAQRHAQMLINNFRTLEKHCGKAPPLVSDVGILDVNDMHFPHTITIIIKHSLMDTRRARPAFSIRKLLCLVGCRESMTCCFMLY